MNDDGSSRNGSDTLFTEKVCAKKRAASRRVLRRSLSEYRFFTYLAVLGPGIIAANAGNDASGIATYSSVGAAYGYSLLWIFIPMIVSLIIVQEMCVRMGVVTGQGLADLIREQFGVRWTAFVMLALLIANTGVIISEFVGIAQASELFGIPRYITIPLTAGSDLVAGRQRLAKTRRARLSGDVARLSLLRDLGLSCEAGLGRRSAQSFIAPDIQHRYGISLYDNGADRHDDHAVYAGLCAIVGRRKTDGCRGPADRPGRCDHRDDLRVRRSPRLSSSAPRRRLHSRGITTIDSAATAAEALVPIAGVYAKYLFAVGLFGAAMLAMGVLPLATAYSVSEALGFEKGLSRSFREAPIFIGIFTALILIGATVALIPGIPQIRLLARDPDRQRPAAADHPFRHRHARQQRGDNGQAQKWTHL